MEHVVGIGGYAASRDQGDKIKTFALSTCVGLVFFSIRQRVLGLSHIQLPSAKGARIDDSPSRYADLAPGYMLRDMQSRFGVTKGEILISLYGGIRSTENDCFRIGEKNIQNVKTALRDLGLIYSDVDTGGRDSRTLVCHVESGIVEVIKRPMNKLPGMYEQISQ